MSSPSFAIREARAADRDSIAALDSESRAEVSKHRGWIQLLDEIGPFDQRWETRGQERTFFVAVVDSLVVGWSSVVERDQDRPLLESVYVTPHARQLGVGSGLLREAISRFGASRLDALSLPGDRLTKNLYERGGLKARLIVASAL